MFDRMFLRRLEREMPRWVERGWLAADHKGAILADVTDRGHRRRTPALVFGGIGALLLAVGVVMFFAANWTGIPRWGKLALIFGMVWGSFGIAALLTHKGYRRFAEAFILLGVLLFGAAILLIGQTYHLPADPPAGVLLWTLAAYLAAYVWPSGLAAILGLCLSGLWASLVVSERLPVLFWPYLLVWAIPLPLILRWRWQAARHIALLAFFFWILVSLVGVGERFSPDMADLLRLGASLGALFVGFGALAAADTRWRDEGYAVGQYGLLLFAGMFFFGIMPGLSGLIDLTDEVAASFAFASAMAAGGGGVAASLIKHGPATRIPWLTVGASSLLLFVSLLPPAFEGVALLSLNFGAIGVWLALVGLGYRADDRFAVNLGFIAFAASMMMIYFTWFWSLFDRSVFFIAGGVLVLVLGWFLEHQRRRLIRRMGEQA